MKTYIKDTGVLKILIEDLTISGDEFICVICGHTMNIHEIECSKCHSKLE